MSRMISFLLERISVKFDAHKLKLFIDIGFIIIEKILIKFQKLHPLYFDFYDEMTENEINLANISEDDRILHIGCGPIPATSILIAKKTGSQITCIDNNPRSVKQAISCVLKYGVAENVKIKHAEANNFPIDKFKVIILSQGIKPYKELLKHISKSIGNDACVIVRTNSSHCGEIAQDDIFLKYIFKIGKMIAHEKNGLLVSILLFKK